MSDLSVNAREEGRFTVLAVTGDVDVVSAPSLRASFERVFREGRFDIVVDLTGVPFLDSTGLGVLVGAQRAVRTRQGDARVVCSDPRVLRVFSITGVDQVFDVYDTVDRAVAGERSQG